jgi:hypothetical protein
VHRTESTTLVFSLQKFPRTAVFAGIDADPARLSREVKEIENDYKQCCAELGYFFDLLHPGDFPSDDFEILRYRHALGKTGYHPPEQIRPKRRTLAELELEQLAQQ